MNNIEIVLIDAAEKALMDDFPNFKDQVNWDFNIFDAVDSFSLVNILLETELAVENLSGKYTPLASELLFDALKSPFLKWSDWVDYVSNTLNIKR